MKSYSFKSLLLTLVVSFSFFCNCFGQSVWRSEIPDAFKYPNHSLAIVYPTWVALGLDDEQQKQARELFAEYDEKQKSGRSREERRTNRANFVSQFEALLSPEQQDRFDLLVVKDYFKKLSERASHVSKPNDLQLSRFFVSNEVVRFLEIREDQESKITKSYEDVNAAIKEAKDHFTNDLATLFKRWQTELESQLLAPQLTIYLDSLGDSFGVPRLLKNIVNISKGSLPQFLQTERKFENSFLSNPPQPEYMLMTTPWFIDSKPAPAGFLALLLSPEVVEELNLTADQLTKLKELQKSWSEKHPLPSELKVTISFGRDMTSQRQREAVAKEGEYGAVYESIYGELNQLQSRRLKQVWNRLIISAGWEEVPLTFPDWRSYLELSDDQSKAFDEINRRFLSEVKSMQGDLKQKVDGLVKPFSQTISETLSAQQKSKAKQVFGAVFLEQKHDGK